MVNSLLEIVGLALLVTAAAFVAIPLAILVAGLELVLLANLRETRGRAEAGDVVNLRSSQAKP